MKSCKKSLQFPPFKTHSFSFPSWVTCQNHPRSRQGQCIYRCRRHSAPQSPCLSKRAQKEENSSQTSDSTSTNSPFVTVKVGAMMMNGNCEGHGNDIHVDKCTQNIHLTGAFLEQRLRGPVLDLEANNPRNAKLPRGENDHLA